MLHTGNPADRELALELLRHHALPEAVDRAAVTLREAGREQDALVLEHLAIPFHRWPLDRAEELRSAGVNAIETGNDVTISEVPGPVWEISHDGRGHLALQVPPEFRCYPPDPSEMPLTVHSMFTVTGMSCEHCVAAITRELSHLAGVSAVGVDLTTGVVTVTSDRALDHEAVAAAIDEAGYELTS